jgi:CRISPR-associated protein Csm2
MAGLTTLDDLTRLLQQPKPLAELLKPQDFASEGLVADTLARKFKDSLKPTQLRKVFHTFKRLQQQLLTARSSTTELTEDFRAKLSLLTPDLAYAVGRELVPKEFYDLLKLCLSPQKMRTVADFQRLVEFLSAVLAYQKYHHATKD